MYQIIQIDQADAEKDDAFKQTKDLMRVMNLAINNFLTIFAFFILNLRFVSSVLYLAIYSFFMCYLVNESIFPL